MFNEVFTPDNTDLCNPISSSPEARAPQSPRFEYELQQKSNSESQSISIESNSKKTGQRNGDKNLLLSANKIQHDTAGLGMWRIFTADDKAHMLSVLNVITAQFMWSLLLRLKSAIDWSNSRIVDLLFVTGRRSFSPGAYGELRRRRRRKKHAHKLARTSSSSLEEGK